MTIAVDLGRKANKQTKTNKYKKKFAYLHVAILKILDM